MMKVGMGQILVEGGEPERNLDRALKIILEASEKKCNLVLLPECLDLGWTHPSALTEAQPIPGAYSEKLCQAASDRKIFICAGLTEKTKSHRFNTALLINDQGDIILKYRKINTLKVEQPFYEVGQKLAVVNTTFGKIGVNICSDNYENSLVLGHALARMGAQIILSPSSWTVDYHISEAKDPYQQKWFKPYWTLAKLYNLVILGTTCVGYIVGGPYEGKKMVGCSLAVNQNGILAQGPYLEFAGDLVTAEFDVPVRKEKGTELSDLIKRNIIHSGNTYL